MEKKYSTRNYFRLGNLFLTETLSQFIDSIISAEVTMNEVQDVSGADTLALSSAAGHIGRAFGLGWAITGACPGPLFAQIGSGFLVVIVTLFSAIAGTWVYGLLQKKLPH